MFARLALLRHRPSRFCIVAIQESFFVVHFNFSICPGSLGPNKIHASHHIRREGVGQCVPFIICQPDENGLLKMKVWARVQRQHNLQRVRSPLEIQIQVWFQWGQFIWLIFVCVRKPERGNNHHSGSEDGGPCFLHDHTTFQSAWRGASGL